MERTADREQGGIVADLPAQARETLHLATTPGRRPHAGVTTSDSEACAGSGLPAAVLVHAALGAEGNLDFPQVTEICERLEVAPLELEEAVRVLVIALGDGGQESSRMKLKALTIANEMMYSTRAVEAFRNTPGLRDALQQLRSTRGSGYGVVTDENVRMLATEVERVCFGQAGPSTQGVPASADPLLQGLQQPTSESNLDRLERARQKAQRSFSSFGKKAAKAMDTAANKVMQDAERTWDQLVGADAPALHMRQDPHMQWALNASLEEERRRRAAPTARSGGSSMRKRPQLVRASTAPAETQMAAAADVATPSGELVSSMLGGDFLGFMGEVSTRDRKSVV